MADRAPERRCRAIRRRNPEMTSAGGGSWAVNRLGLSVLGQLDKENSFMSPLSIYAALALAAAGATEGSDHLQELEKVLRSQFGDRESMKGVAEFLLAIKPDSSDATLDVANAVWIKDNVKQEYASTVSEVFQASVQAMPASAAPINSWCNEKTKGMIPSIIDSIDPRMVAILTNAVYFKGTWMDKFKPQSTVKKQFHTFSGPKECMMMQRTAKEMQYKLVKFDNGMKAHVVILPYEANEFTAKLILPETRGKDAFVNLAKYLANDPKEYAEHTRFFGRRHLELILPKFKVESFNELSGPLKSIGLSHVFGTTGGFQRMSEDPQVRMDEVLHKVSVEVTEEGTEAAAVTAIMMRTNAMVQQRLALAFDRPFLFFIEHSSSRTVLFAGRVEDPKFLGL
uniref:Serpin domain-containing protein n=1 Tax=Picocystis salinarum TaxID=88271 RepID=A0A7S3UE05_9CHLO|mmetsp:Transcript_7504/g.46136  ORF Transcript_7504/g.46136 Transcript_7504/m.46136 type:complete len:397 (+) Transcript_7504:360-1550(+)